MSIVAVSRLPGYASSHSLREDGLTTVGSTSDLPSPGTKVGGFRLHAAGPGQMMLKRNLLLTLVLGIGGGVLLLAGIGMGIGLRDQLVSGEAGHWGENRGAMKMILFLVCIGGLGLATLFGTSALVFDSEGGRVERRRLLGLLRTTRKKSDLKSVDVTIFTVPNGTVMCSFEVLTINKEKFSPGVQYPVTDPSAAVLARLTLWISRKFAIPYRVLMNPAISRDSIPDGALKALLA